MRSSSVKTLVSVVSVTLTLVLAAPSTEARPSQRQRPTQSAPSVVDRAQRVVRQVLKRVFGISIHGMPGDPIPDKLAEPTSVTHMPGDPIPVSEP